MLTALRDRVHHWQWKLALRRASRRQWAFCTIATRSFLPQAQVLFDSLRAVHPEARRVLLFVGTHSADIAALDWPGVCVIGVHDLIDAEEERTLRRRYTIAEFCFALKPRLLLHVIDHLAQRAVYLDSDIRAYSRFDAVFVTLEQSSIALTPHLDTPLPDDGRLPSDVTILRSGAFNLGFVAAAATAHAKEILQWWDRRVRRWGYVAPDAGYQGDQKWMDLAAGVFPAIGIVRDAGHNVAYWNLHSRKLAATEGGITVQGVPLIFFHFSGYDPSRPERLSRFTNRIRLEEGSVTTQLVRDYSALVATARSAMASPPHEPASSATAAAPLAGTAATGLLPTQAYQAKIVVESDPGVLETLEEAVLKVTVTNASPLNWPVAPGADGRGGLFLSWHFRRDGKELLQWDNPRFGFRADVPPGGSETIEVHFRVPASPGRYMLEFDLLHEGLAWFSEHGSQTTIFPFGVGVFLEESGDAGA